MLSFVNEDLVAFFMSKKNSLQWGLTGAGDLLRGEVFLRADSGVPVTPEAFVFLKGVNGPALFDDGTDLTARALVLITLIMLPKLDGEDCLL